MNTSAAKAPAKTKKDPRTTALRRFAASISVFTILGHTVLGFEQAYATPLVALAVAYILEAGLETIDARAQRRPVKYAGGRVALFDFLLPAHITGLACAMLLYANSRLGPVVFAVTIAITSKYLVRVRIKGRLRHVLNPSNLGIATVLFLFPWVGIAPPYQFTEWFGSPLDWIVPAAVLLSGTMLNAQLTRKMPLILAWLGVFVLQAVVRTAIEHTSTVSALLAMSGVAFILFTNYMITDPGTTPMRPLPQVAFGAATAATYGVLVFLHVVYGLFFALVIVCILRGIGLGIASARRRRDDRVSARPESESESESEPQPEPSATGAMLTPAEEAR